MLYAILIILAFIALAIYACCVAGGNADEHMKIK